VVLADDAVVFFSPMVSGIAVVLLLYMSLPGTANKQLICAAWTLSPATCSTPSLSTSAGDARPRSRIYEADESFRSLDFMVHTRLYTSQVIVQIMVATGTIALLALRRS